MKWSSFCLAVLCLTRASFAGGQSTDPASLRPADVVDVVVLGQPTLSGDFVLDNMRNKVLLWSETEYRYLKRQSSANAGKWVKLQDGRADAVGSVK